MDDGKGGSVSTEDVLRKTIEDRDRMIEALRKDLKTERERCADLAEQLEEAEKLAAVRHVKLRAYRVVVADLSR